MNTIAAGTIAHFELIQSVYLDGRKLRAYVLFERGGERAGGVEARTQLVAQCRSLISSFLRVFNGERFEGRAPLLDE
jgi:hypothetical protein